MVSEVICYYRPFIFSYICPCSTRIFCICPPFSLHWLKTNVYFFALSLIAVSRLNLQLLLGYTILYVVSTSLQSVYKKILLLILKEIYHFHFFYILQVSVINSIDTSHEDMIVSHLEHKIIKNDFTLINCTHMYSIL